VRAQASSLDTQPPCVGLFSSAGQQTGVTHRLQLIIYMKQFQKLLLFWCIQANAERWNARIHLILNLLKRGGGWANPRALWLHGFYDPDLQLLAARSSSPAPGGADP
jgi:hypothetical protein